MPIGTYELPKTVDNLPPPSEMTHEINMLTDKLLDELMTLANRNINFAEGVVDRTGFDVEEGDVAPDNGDETEPSNVWVYGVQALRKTSEDGKIYYQYIVSQTRREEDVDMPEDIYEDAFGMMHAIDDEEGDDDDEEGDLKHGDDDDEGEENLNDEKYNFNDETQYLIDTDTRAIIEIVSSSYSDVDDSVVHKVTSFDTERGPEVHYHRDNVELYDGTIVEGTEQHVSELAETKLGIMEDVGNVDDAMRNVEDIYEATGQWLTLADYEKMLEAEITYLNLVRAQDIMHKAEAALLNHAGVRGVYESTDAQPSAVGVVEASADAKPISVRTVLRPQLLGGIATRRVAGHKPVRLVPSQGSQQRRRGTGKKILARVGVRGYK